MAAQDPSALCGRRAKRRLRLSPPIWGIVSAQDVSVRWARDGRFISKTVYKSPRRFTVWVCALMVHFLRDAFRCVLLCAFQATSGQQQHHRGNHNTYEAEALHEALMGFVLVPDRLTGKHHENGHVVSFARLAAASVDAVVGSMRGSSCAWGQDVQSFGSIRLASPSSSTQLIQQVQPPHATDSTFKRQL